MATIKFLRTVRLNESRAYAAGQEYQDVEGGFAENMVNSGTAVYCEDAAIDHGQAVESAINIMADAADAALTAAGVDGGEEQPPKRGRPRKSESE